MAGTEARAEEALRTHVATYERQAAEAAEHLREVEAQLTEVRREAGTRPDLERTLIQLAELRRVRAELARKLARAHQDSVDARREADAASESVSVLQLELEQVHRESEARRAELEETIEAARTRVQFLEARLVQAQAQRVPESP